MIKRLFQVVVVAVVLLAGATAVGYFGFRVGRRFAVNQPCCGLFQRHNFEVSVRANAGAESALSASKVRVGR